MLRYLLILLLIGTSGWTTRNSLNFAVKYQNPDRQVIAEVIDMLEDHYQRIAVEVGSDINHRVEVYIHPDRHSLLQSSGLRLASEWLVGVAINDREIHLISPLNPPGNNDSESVMDGLIHELVHICVANAGDAELPLWLNEGLAVYHAGQYRFAQEVPGLVRERIFFPSLNTLSESEGFDREHGYSLSYTIVEFMMREYGPERVRAFIKNYPNYNVLGLRSEMELENAWHYYLKYNYADPPALQQWVDHNENIFHATLDPNPVLEYAKLDFTAMGDEDFILRVLDPWGRRMQTLFYRPIIAGFHTFRIDATKFPDGIFYLEMTHGDSQQLIRFTTE